jgi:transcription elongation factor Elf1
VGSSSQLKGIIKMSAEDFEYEVSCPICDTETDVTVYNVDEKPIFCPMCGEQADISLVE